uniref:Uncharacterized protein n=1 Tax=Rhizophora mucronata TaxID=61149 RepID=A0A2P2P2X3_RHIMU
MIGIKKQEKNSTNNNMLKLANHFLTLGFLRQQLAFKEAIFEEEETLLRKQKQKE